MAMASDTTPYFDKEKLLVECMQIIDQHFRSLHEQRAEAGDRKQTNGEKNQQAAPHLRHEEEEP
jgi:hypothetical protein